MAELFEDILQQGKLKPEVNSQNTNPLSELEEGILTVLIGKELYGLQIVQAFEAASQGNRKLSIGSLYPTLHRLEQKGYVVSRMDAQPKSNKGGARRKYFQITILGADKVLKARMFRSELQMWQPAT